MRRLLVVIFCAAMGLWAAPCSAQSIGVYFDTAATDCDATIQANTPGTFYLIARLEGSFSNGMTGAEFRVTGLPAGWFITNAFPCPCIPELPGNPYAEGVMIGFASCQPGPLVLLFGTTYFATSAPPDVRLRVTSHSTPSNPNFPCPLLVHCDAPVFTRECVAGGEAIINGPPCTVGVAPRSWSSIKGLYD